MQRSPDLTGSPLLVKNTLLNLLGYGSPLVVALFSIPKIIQGMGTERFGILTLAWVLIGYFGLLDMGLGRALTVIVAEKLGADQTDDIPSTIWTALFAMLLIAVALSATALLCNHWIVYDLLNIPAAIEQETYQAFVLLACFTPVVILSVGFRGILEAYQRFDIVNAVRIPLGIFSFIAPLAVIPFSVNLQWVILVLCIGRGVAACLQFLLCCKIIPDLPRNLTIAPQKFRILMRFGGWMTITNVINPLLVNVDRLFIGSLLSIAAVTFYATPCEIITKLTLISGALMSVLFPAISSSYHVDRQRSALLLESGLKYIFIGIFPIVLLIVAFAPEGLAFWLDDRFLQHSTLVTRILAIGILFACLGQIPYAFIQGAGRPDLTGKLHLIELLPHIIFVVLSIHWAGIAGAAAIWTIRFIIDTIAMYLIAQKLIGNHRLMDKPTVAAVLVGVAAIGILALLEPLQWRVVVCLLAMAAFILASSLFLLTADEKTFFWHMFKFNQKSGRNHLR